MSMTV